MGVPEFSVKGIRLRKVFFQIIFWQIYDVGLASHIDHGIIKQWWCSNTNNLVSNLFSESP